MLDDKVPHSSVSILDFFGIAPTKAVLSVYDRLENERNAVFLELLDHHRRLFVGDVRVLRAVDEQRWRVVSSDVSHRLKGCDLLGNRGEIEAAHFARPDAALAVVQINQAAVSLSPASIGDDGSVRLLRGFFVGDLSRVVARMGTRRGVPIPDQVAVAIQCDERLGGRFHSESGYQREVSPCGPTSHDDAITVEMELLRSIIGQPTECRFNITDQFWKFRLRARR